MDRVNRIRQRRFVEVQMRAETDMLDEPCMAALTNDSEDSSIFGPYLETCPGASEGRGCYDVEITDREIRSLEYQVCIEAASANEFWQSGNDDCIIDIEDLEIVNGGALWGQSVMLFEPGTIYATNDESGIGDDENLLCCLTTDNMVYVKSHGFNPSTCPWVRMTTVISGTYEDIVVNEIICFSSTTTVIVLDENKYPWELVRYATEEDGTITSFVSPFLIGGHHNQFVFLKSYL